MTSSMERILFARMETGEIARNFEKRTPVFRG